ncbi:Probable calcium-binding protein CML29 [Linum perenne]
MARAHQLSSETERLNQVVTLVEAFKAFDSDNDGFITAAELGGILGSLGYSAAGEQDVRAMMLQGDKDKDGLLSVGEFLEMNTKDMEVGGVIGNLLKAAMEALDDEDEDDTTLVTGEELWEFMADASGGSGQRQMSLADCQAIVAAMDVDGDGAISSQDLKLIATSLL